LKALLDEIDAKHFMLMDEFNYPYINPLVHSVVSKGCYRKLDVKKATQN